MDNDKMSLRILFFGHRGWIGRQVYDLLKHHACVQSIFLSEVRPQNTNELQYELDSLHPTHVISTIGRTHGTIDGVDIPTIDYLEHPGKLLENATDNLYAPIVLAHECYARGIHYTYLGTGCIFEYDADHDLHSGNGFKEDDKPNFYGSSYSVIKGITDQIMHLYKNSALNVRIRMPITAEPSPRDFITKIVNYQRICSMENSMTVLDELLPLLVDMMVQNRTGTVHLTNPGTISHEDILTMYKEICDGDKTWETMSYEEQSRLLKSKRSNNELDTSLLQSWYPDVSDIKTSVLHVLKQRRELYMKQLE